MGRDNRSSWTLPPSNWYKLTVHAAVFEQSKMAGFGAIIKNAEGEIMAVGVKKSRVLW